jgi:hypothetical protein
LLFFVFPPFFDVFFVIFFFGFISLGTVSFVNEGGLLEGNLSTFVFINSFKDKFATSVSENSTKNINNKKIKKK